MTTFSAQVSDAIRQFEGALEAVFLGSVQDIGEQWQRNMKVITGANRAALTGGVNAEPPAVDGASRSGNEWVVEIAGANLGDVVMMRRTMAYSAREEFGFVGRDSLGRYYNTRGSGSMRRAIQMWPQIVKENEAKVSAALGR